MYALYKWRQSDSIRDRVLALKSSQSALDLWLPYGPLKATRSDLWEQSQEYAWDSTYSPEGGDNWKWSHLGPFNKDVISCHLYLPRVELNLLMKCT